MATLTVGCFQVAERLPPARRRHDGVPDGGGARCRGGELHQDDQVREADGALEDVTRRCLLPTMLHTPQGTVKIWCKVLPLGCSLA